MPGLIVMQAFAPPVGYRLTLDDDHVGRSWVAAANMVAFLMDVMAHGFYRRGRAVAAMSTSCMVAGLVRVNNDFARSRMLLAPVLVMMPLVVMRFALALVPRAFMPGLCRAAEQQG